MIVRWDSRNRYDEIRNPEISGVQSGTALDGSVSLNYFCSGGDQFFLMYKLIGKRFTRQGYVAAYGQGTIQYNHKLTLKVKLVVSLNDPFRQTKSQTVIDTPLLRSRYVNSHEAPTFMIGLSRSFSSFGSVPKKKQ